MVTAKKSAIIYTVLLSLALLVPSLMIFTTDHKARSSWELRRLDTLPSISDMADDPKAGFKQFDGWMNDHVGFSFQAIRFRKRFLYKHLGVTGDKYIVRNKDGDLFLTSRFNDNKREMPFSWFDGNCRKSVTRHYTALYVKSLSASNKVLSRFGAKTIFTAVPTKSVLLTDKFPASTHAPPQIRCFIRIQLIIGQEKAIGPLLKISLHAKIWLCQRLGRRGHASHIKCAGILACLWV